MGIRYYTKRLVPYIILFLPFLIYFAGCSKSCNKPGGMPTCPEAKVSMVNNDNCTCTFVYTMTKNTSPYNMKIRFESNNSPITNAVFDYKVTPGGPMMPINGYTVLEQGESMMRTFTITNPAPPFTGDLGNFTLSLKPGSGTSTISCELLDNDNNPCMITNFNVNCK